MTDHKTPLKFPNQVEQKHFNPVAPPQYRRGKNVIDILLILGDLNHLTPGNDLTFRVNTEQISIRVSPETSCI